MSCLNVFLIVLLFIACCAIIYLLFWDKKFFPSYKIETEYDGNEEFQNMKTKNGYSHEPKRNVKVGGELIDVRHIDKKIEFFSAYINKKKKIGNLPISFLTKNEDGVIRHHILYDNTIYLRSIVDIYSNLEKTVIVRVTEYVLLEKKSENGDVKYEIESHSYSMNYFTISEFLKLNAFHSCAVINKFTVPMDNLGVFPCGYEFFLKNDLVVEPERV